MTFGCYRDLSTLSSDRDDPFAGCVGHRSLLRLVWSYIVVIDIDTVGYGGWAGRVVFSINYPDGNDPL